VPSIVRPERLMNAITLTSFSQNLSQLAGPAIGGASIAAVGLGGSFAIQAGLLSIGLLVLLPLAVPRAPGAGAAARKMTTEVAEGLRFVWHSGNIRTLIGILTISALITAGPWSTLIPKLAKDELGSGAFGASMLFAAMGLGTLLASLVLASIPRLNNAGGWFLITLMAGPGLMIGMGLSKVYELTLALMFLSGWNAGFFMNLNMTLIQANTPHAVMGRVMSIYSLCFMGGMPLGALLAGAGAGIIGAPAYFASCGALMVCIGFIAFLTQPSLRRMSTIPAER
jgi:predicted MFS family arabinose efflux permease